MGVCIPISVRSQLKKDVPRCKMVATILRVRAVSIVDGGVAEGRSMRSVQRERRKGIDKKRGKIGENKDQETKRREREIQRKRES